MTSSGPVSKTRVENIFRLRERASDEQGVAGFRREVKFALPIADLGKLRTVLDVNCRRTVFNNPFTGHEPVLRRWSFVRLLRKHGRRGEAGQGSVALVRWSGLPIFFEIKRRIGEVIQKRRLAIESSVPLSSITYEKIAKELGRALPPEDKEVLLAGRTRWCRSSTTGSTFDLPALPFASH